MTRAGLRAERSGGGRAVANATITVMFTDMVGSTELIDKLGDVAAERARRAHYQLLRGAIAATNGEEVKNTGDGLMVVFTSIHDAVKCAVAIQQAVARHGRHFPPGLEVRVGIHVGEAIKDEGDYFGATVNISRRLCDLAVPGQILCSSVIPAVLGHRAGISFEPLGPLSLKGFVDPVDACAVTWSSDDVEGPDLPPALAGRERLPFVGRRAEFKALERVWTEAPSGGPRLVGVTGEAGIGKSRVVKEFAVAARDQGAVLLYGRCDEDALVPFQPFVEALRHFLSGSEIAEMSGLPPGTIASLSRLLPELGHQSTTSTDPAMDRYLLFDAVRAFFTRMAREAPVMLVVEDLHWADSPTLGLIGHLALTSEPLPFLVVATYRYTELPQEHPLVALVASLGSKDVMARVRLGGLTPDEVSELVETALSPETAAALTSHLPDAGAAVHARTEGNPLFVRELLRDVEESDAESLVVDRDDRVPEGLRAIIGRRLGRLSEPARSALTVAAVVGNHFGVELVGRASGLDRAALLEALDEAQAAREIVEMPGASDSFAFSHELVRRSLYSQLPRGRRAELHRRVGEAIEEAHASDEAWLSSLARHFIEAAITGVGEKGALYALLAGRREVQSFAYEEAIDTFRRGLDALGTTPRDPRLECELQIALGDALIYVGDVLGWKASFEQAVRTARRIGAADLLAIAARGLGQQGPGATTRDDALVELLEEVIASLGETHTALRAQTKSRLARELFGGGDTDSAERLSREALDEARQTDDPVTLALALNAHRQCFVGLHNLRMRLAIDNEIAALAERANDGQLATTARASLLVDHLRLGDIEAVDADLAELENLTERFRHAPRTAWYVATYRAMRAILAADLEEAERIADAALVQGQKAGVADAAVNHAGHIIAIRRDQGRLAELRGVVEAFAADETGLLAWPVVLGLVHVETGNLDAARDAMRRVTPAELAALPENDFWLFTLALASEVAAAIGDENLAAALYGLLLPASGHNVVVGGAVVAIGAVDRYLGVVAAALGRVEAAERHFADASELNARLQAVAEGIRTRAQWAALLLASDDSSRRDRGRSMATEASAHADAAGLSALAKATRELIASSA